MHYDPYVITIVKILHVLLASIWVGAAFYGGVIVGPNLMQSTPATRREFGGRIMNVAPRIGNIVGGFTVLTGIGLYYMMRDGLSMVTQSDRLLIFGLFIGLASLYLMNFTVKPTVKRLEKLSAEQAPGAESGGLIMILQKRLRITGQVNLILLMVAVVVMVMANTHILE